MTIILCSLFSIRAAKLIKKGDLDSVGTYSIEKREMLHARMKIILLFLRFLIVSCVFLLPLHHYYT